MATPASTSAPLTPMKIPDIPVDFDRRDEPSAPPAGEPIEEKRVANLEELIVSHELRLDLQRNSLDKVRSSQKALRALVDERRPAKRDRIKDLFIGSVAGIAVMTTMLQVIAMTRKVGKK